MKKDCQLLVVCPPTTEDAEMEMPSLGMATLKTRLAKAGYESYHVDLLSETRKSKIYTNYNVTYKLLIDNRNVIEEILASRKNDKFFLGYVDTVLSFLDFKSVSIISFSIIYDAQFIIALLLAKRIKETRSSITIVFGGPLITLKDEEIYSRYSFVDHFIKSEDFEEFLCVIRKSKIKKGISKSTEWVLERSKKCPNFDDFKLENYSRKKNGNEIRVLPYQLNNGCPLNCSFCVIPYFREKTKMNIDAAINDLKFITERYNSRHIYFVDSSLNYDMQYYTDFLNAIIDSKLNISWSGWMNFINLEEKHIALMKKSGCKFAFFGLESASQALLKRMNKHFKIEKAKKLLVKLANLKIKSYVHLMVGYPYETDDDVEETCRFIKQYGKYIYQSVVSSFLPIENSMIFQHPERFKIKLRAFDAEESTFYKNHCSMELYGFDELEGESWETILVKRELRRTKINKYIYRYINQRHVYNPLVRMVPFEIYNFLLNNQNKNLTIRFFINLFRRINGLQTDAYKSRLDKFFDV